MECVSCKEKATLVCGLCEGSLCKQCAEFGRAVEFTYFTKLPDVLSHNQYCAICYVSKVTPMMLEYKRLLRLAKDINILEKQPREALRVLRKAAKPLSVIACSDREETVLRLAFQAAELGFNSVIKAKVVYKKVRDYGYQKMEWHGSGYAADLDL